MCSPWHTAYASVIGTSHEKTQTPCQDACRTLVIHTHEGQEIFLGAVSDGAGSAAKAKDASSMAMEMFFETFSKVIRSEDDLLLINKTFVLDWLEKVKTCLFNRARQEELDPREFACTFLGAIVGNQQAIFFQIGDGAIVISDAPTHPYNWVFWPQHGDFANQTNFIIQEHLAEVLAFQHFQGVINRIALFTDGLERLILDFSTRLVHPPALHSIFEWLQNASPSSLTDSLSPALNAFLSSSFINQRTDDDKSLVMAARAIY